AIVSNRLPLVFPVHPRTRKNLEDFGLWHEFSDIPGVIAIDPLGYVNFMNIVCSARLVITDSGGVQEETTYLDIPCLTLRTTTERPITLTEGSNRLVTVRRLAHTVDKIISGQWTSGRKPALWDGHAAERVSEDIRRRMLDAEGMHSGSNSAQARKGTELGAGRFGSALETSALDG